MSDFKYIVKLIYYLWSIIIEVGFSGISLGSTLGVGLFHLKVILTDLFSVATERVKYMPSTLAIIWSYFFYIFANLID